MDNWKLESRKVAVRVLSIVDQQVLLLQASLDLGPLGPRLLGSMPSRGVTMQLQLRFAICHLFSSHSCAALSPRFRSSYIGTVRQSGLNRTGERCLEYHRTMIPPKMTPTVLLYYDAVTLSMRITLVEESAPPPEVKHFDLEGGRGPQPSLRQTPLATSYLFQVDHTLLFVSSGDQDSYSKPHRLIGLCFLEPT